MKYYTPTLDEVRRGAASIAGFDRWLADHDAEVRADQAQVTENEILADLDSAIAARRNHRFASYVDGIRLAWSIVQARTRP